MSDPRIEAACAAWVQHFNDHPGERIAAVFDALRAYDATHPPDPTAPPAGADPPWLDEANNYSRASALVAEIGSTWKGGNQAERASIVQQHFREFAREILAFAARQPRPITDVAVAAAEKVLDLPATAFPTWDDRVRAALEAAERAREQQP